MIAATLLWFRSLTPKGWAYLLAILLVLSAVLGFGGVLLWNAWQATATAKTEAKLGKNQTGAALASGADAVATVGEVGARADDHDTITKENADAFRSAPGAAAPVGAPLDAVARERLCRRAVYRVRPECLQFPAAD
ncbi:hypothetical protein ACLBKU_12100 [Erythrobacter sp. NE805]|uniref:hypothetical protein n=1 Tax=Erythrobacter sp. NE805 TaxID=3389875 RepID=UPI00396B028B